MTFAERVKAIEAFGFTSRQAAFLTTVALHSGYCLRRQYASFTQQVYGKNVCVFLEGLVERGLARRLRFRADRGSIYHLFSRRMYEALGQDNNRNRRHTSPPLIARKLMLLDFVLSRPELDWYATEDEKVDLLVNRFEVPESALPRRAYTSPAAGEPNANTTRYLVQKLPVFVTADPRTVNFVVVGIDPSGVKIAAFVREHAPLLRHLPRWTLHVALPNTGATEDTASDAFRRAVAAASQPAISGDDLAWLNRTREIVEGGQLHRLAVPELRRYRELSRIAPNASGRTLTGRLVLQRLPHSYEQFGSLAGLA